MLIFETEFELVKLNKNNSRYNFLLCVIFCQAINNLLKKLEPHKLSLCLLKRKKKDLNYHLLIGLVNPRGNYYHCQNLFTAYHINVPSEIYNVYNIYNIFKVTHTKLHSTFKSAVLCSNIEHLLIELFDISYYERFKAENLKNILEDNLIEKNPVYSVKI